MTNRDYVLFVGQSLALGLPDDGVYTDLRGAQAHPSSIQRFMLNGTLTANQLPDETILSTATKPARSFADEAWAGGASHLVVNTHGDGGKTYAQLKKGSSYYTESMNAVTSGVSVNPGDTFIPRSLHIVHGEADQGAGTTRAAYAADLVEWLSDYNTDLKAATGSPVDMSAFLCQMTSSGVLAIALAQVDAARANPRTYLVGPKYQFRSTLHLNAADYDHLGDLHAKAYRAVVTNGGTWWPVLPSRVAATGQAITIDFHVPTPPLVFDTTLLSAKTAMGFVVRDDVGTKVISSVTLTGPARVQINVTTPLRGNPMVQYGSSVGGNLRDSDPEVSTYDAYPLYNWCCLFDEPITVLGQATTQKARYATRGGFAL